MANENGEWIMHGLDWDSPYRIRTWQELYPDADEEDIIRLIGKKRGSISYRRTDGITQNLKR